MLDAQKGFVYGAAFTDPGKWGGVVGQRLVGERHPWPNSRVSQIVRFVAPTEITAVSSIAISGAAHEINAIYCVANSLGLSENR